MPIIVLWNEVQPNGQSKVACEPEAQRTGKIRQYKHKIDEKFKLKWW